MVTTFSQECEHFNFYVRLKYQWWPIRRVTSGGLGGLNGIFLS